jgi:hypothetical protein
MKRVFLLILAGVLTAGFTGNLCAQQSLGDVARENRKAKKPKAVKVYDNDNLPTSAPISTVGIVNPPADAKSKDSESKDSDKDGKKDEQAKSESSEAEARQKVENQLKDDIEKQRAKIADIAHELDLLNREYHLRTALYYSDAGTRLRNPQIWAEEDLSHRNKISAKEQELSAAQAKLADLEEAARKAGMPSKSVE